MITDRRPAHPPRRTRAGETPTDPDRLLQPGPLPAEDMRARTLPLPTE